MANGNSYLVLASRAEELNVGENSQAELDVSARAGFATSEHSLIDDKVPLHGVMFNKLSFKIITYKFNSHWVLFTSSLVPNSTKLDECLLYDR